MLTKFIRMILRKKFLKCNVRGKYIFSSSNIIVGEKWKFVWFIKFIKLYKNFRLRNQKYFQ